MRDPYRFCFDTVTGELIRADVGQNDGNYVWATKEVDFLFNRANWPVGPAGGRLEIRDLISDYLQ
jgi:hypothetical protein